MIIIFEKNLDQKDQRVQHTLKTVGELNNIKIELHQVDGQEGLITEAYLIGDTRNLITDEIAALPGVARVVRISDPYYSLAHKPFGQNGFTYQGVDFSQETLNIFAGLCAVDNREHTELMMRALQSHGLVCTRMGAYKPRTTPHHFQGHGKTCLPYVFELAGKYGIKVIAMEVVHEDNIEEIGSALRDAGDPTGVMLQVGTRNAQNFELLKAVGSQKRFPVLLKRGFGITLNESLHAAEYVADSGNENIIFCLRGVKTHLGDPHRNLTDFVHIPVVKRRTCMPVCVDPSHSVGSRELAPDQLTDMMHATAQGVIAGANMILADVHPVPSKALVDGRQALTLDELPLFLEDIEIVRQAYLSRLR